MDTESMKETLNKDFINLTDKNRENILEMTKFLVLTQNAIVPNILKENADTPFMEENKG